MREGSFFSCTTYTASRAVLTFCVVRSTRHYPSHASEIAWYTNMDSACSLYEPKVLRTLLRSSAGSHHTVMVVEDCFPTPLNLSMVWWWRSCIEHDNNM
jgi:hypothetical protein